MKNLLFLIMAAVLLAGCTKEEKVQLPEATHHGANTFGCLIDGEPFVVTGKYSNVSSLGVYFIPFSNTAWTVDGNTRDGHISLEFDYNNNPRIPGIFLMANNYPAGGLYINKANGTAVTGGNEFKTNAEHKGTVTLTHYDGNFAAGTFAFDCINDAGAVIHITEGRFDITKK